jgi:DNA-binding HxlR family transcriptional regulator
MKPKTAATEKPQHLPLTERTAYRRLEDVVGCKWSAAVLAAIGRGVSRPGQLERFIPGISTKILNERLRKLVDYRLITRTEISRQGAAHGVCANGYRHEAERHHRKHP